VKGEVVLRNLKVLFETRSQSGGKGALITRQKIKCRLVNVKR